MNGSRGCDRSSELPEGLEICNLPEPFEREIDEFLAGDLTRDLDIDVIFGRPFQEFSKNYDFRTLSFGLQVMSVTAIGYKISVAEIARETGVVLLSPANRIVGAYLGCSLGIMPEHQGLGLGAELVFEYAYTFGSLPTWFLDTPAYSPAGLAAHRRAWFLARNSAFMERKKGVSNMKRGMPIDLHPPCGTISRALAR